MDYNGDGIWTRDEITRRYHAYCQQLGQTPNDISPRTHTNGDSTWVYPVMYTIIEGVETGDRACIAIALDFIEEDAKFPFGKGLKSNAARALRRATLDEPQKERIRERVVGLLERGYVPYEFRDFAKLLKRVGLGAWRVRLENIDPQNIFVRRFRSYLLQS